MEICQHTQIKAIRCLNGKDVDTELYIDDGE